SRITPLPTLIRSPRIHTDLISLDTEKLKELTSQPTESTQGTYRTPSSPRSPNPKRSTRPTPPTPILTIDKAVELILQDTLQVSLVEHKSRQDQEARENVALVDEHLASVEIEKMVEGQENVVDNSSIPRNDEHNIPSTRLEPRSDKESPEVEFTDVVIPMNVYDKEEEEDEITDEVYELKRKKKEKNVKESRITPLPTLIRSPRIHTDLISLDTEKLKELTIIIGHYMTNLPEILRSARDKYHNLKDGDLMKNIFNSGRYKDKVGMKIPDWMITEVMKQTDHYRMYAKVFGIDVPLTQSQSTESTQGTYRTPSAPRSPNPKVDATELSAPT
nr:hypothetical protein [Tanacetum cinerariifolium]